VQKIHTILVIKYLVDSNWLNADSKSSRIVILLREYFVFMNFEIIFELSAERPRSSHVYARDSIVLPSFFLDSCAKQVF